MRRLLISIILLFAASLLADAQTVVRNEKMFQDGRNVTITFEVDTDHTDIPNLRKEVILPFIYNGKDTLYLDPMEIYGKGRFKRERQINAINGDKDWALSDNQTLKNGGVYIYEAQVPLKRWMKSAVLGIRRQMVGCACEKDMTEEDIAQASLFEEPQLPPRRLPEYSLSDLTREWDFGQDQLEIVFKVSRIEIDSSVFNNEVTFGKILKAVDKIHSNPAYKIDKIEVAGYASPEGRPGFNNWLGYNRALALINYIIKQRPEYNLTMDHFRIVNGDENWEGLKWALQNYEFEYKDRVLAIINDQTLPSEQKKDKIKRIDHGKTWKKMLDDIYPYLRCARYLAVYYDSTNNEAIDIINQANSLIREGKYVEAYEHVMPVADDMRAYNTIGVALMMQLRFEEAMPWLQKAVENGFQDAQNNMDAINVEYDYEEQQRMEIEDYLNKFN